METKNQFTFKWVSEAASSFIKKIRNYLQKKENNSDLGPGKFYHKEPSKVM